MSDNNAAKNPQQAEKSMEDILKRWKTWQQRMLQTMAVNKDNMNTSTHQASTQIFTFSPSSIPAGLVADVLQLPPPIMPLPPTPVIVQSHTHAASHTHRHSSMPTFPLMTSPTIPNPRRHSAFSTEHISRTMGPPEKIPMPGRQRLLNRMVTEAGEGSSAPTVALPEVRLPRTINAAEPMLLPSTSQHPVMPSALNPPQDLTSPRSLTRNPSPANTGLLQAILAPVTLPNNDSNYLFQVTITNGPYKGRCLSHQRLLSLPKSWKIIDLFLLMGILFHYENTTSWSLVRINIDCPGVWKEPEYLRFRRGRLLCDSSKTMRGPHQTIGDLDDPDYAGYVLWVVLRIHDADGVDDQGNVKFKTKTENVSHLMQLIGRATGPAGRISCLGGTGEPSEDGVVPPFMGEDTNDRLVECFGEEARRFDPQDTLMH